jgi:hypothetical protein
VASISEAADPVAAAEPGAVGNIESDLQGREPQ